MTNLTLWGYGLQSPFKGFHFFIGITTYLDMRICYHASMTSYFQEGIPAVRFPACLHLIIRCSTRYQNMILYKTTVEMLSFILRLRNFKVSMKKSGSCSSIMESSIATIISFLLFILAVIFFSTKWDFSLVLSSSLQINMQSLYYLSIFLT